MEWWKIVLIIVGAVVVGLGAGYVLNILIVRILSELRQPRKRPVPQARPPIAASPQSQTEPSVPDLYAEIEYNRRVATGEWTGQLQSFQTHAWDNRGDEVHTLPPEVRTELTEAYSDMALANSITWLSTEMSRRSPSLDDSYLKLRSSVATRLNKVRYELGDLAHGTKSGSAK